MGDTYKTLNNIQTLLFSCGNPFDCKVSDVIICVTGNPGVPDFYREFALKLYANTGFPVCVIGQAGHVQVPDYKSNVLENQYHLFNLDGQLAHKLDLIDSLIDKNSRLHLIGHSIGAWIITELLQRHKYLMDRIATINLLFPTIQGMAQTKNGKFLNGFLRRINFIMILLFTIAYWLPHSMRVYLVNMYLKFNSLPAYYSERVLKFLNPNVGEKVLFLAYDEMDTVVSLNSKAIDDIKHLTNVIYSTRDNWVPMNYIESLKIFQPQLELNEVNINHAFVFKSSERVADMASDFIKKKL